MDMFNQIIRLIPVGLVIFVVTQIVTLTKNVLRSLSITEFEQMLMKKEDYRIDEHLKGVHFYMSQYIMIFILAAMLYWSKVNTFNVLKKLGFISLLIVFCSCIYISIIHGFKKYIFSNSNRVEKVEKFFVILIFITILSIDILASIYFIESIKIPNIILKAISCVGAESLVVILAIVILIWMYKVIFDMKKSKVIFKHEGKKRIVTTDTYLLRGIDSEKIILMDNEKYKEAKYIYIHNIDDDTYNVFQKMLVEE